MKRQVAMTGFGLGKQIAVGEEDQGCDAMIDYKVPRMRSTRVKDSVRTLVSLVRGKVE